MLCFWNYKDRQNFLIIVRHWFWEEHFDFGNGLVIFFYLHQWISAFVDETGSVHTYEAVLNGTPCWDESEPVVVSKAEFESRSFKTKRPAATDPSPQVSKFCRQLSHNSVYQSSKDPVQSVSHTSTALQAGLTARREVVHRLRQQIRSRDAMIYDMQVCLCKWTLFQAR